MDTLSSTDQRISVKRQLLTTTGSIENSNQTKYQMRTRHPLI